MPFLPEASGCCCPAPLGGGCNSQDVGVARVFWTCAQHLIAILYAASATGCDDESEITEFGLNYADPLNPLPYELLQPFNFYKEDDFSGFQAILNSTIEDGASNANVEINTKIIVNSPEQESILRANKGREIVFVAELRNGLYKIYGQNGGIRLTTVTIDSSQLFATLQLTGQPTQEPRFLSFTDGGAWAEANLVPFPAGLVNA